MKFKSYQNQAQIGPSATGITNYKYSNPGAIAAAKESGNTGVVIGNGIMALVDKVNNTKAMEANNFYNQRMTEESNDLINNHKEGNALNVTELYDEAQKKVMDETMQKYGNYLRFGKGADDFKAFTNKDNQTRRISMQKYQLTEMEKYENSVFENQVKSSQFIATAAGYTAESMDESMGRLEANIRQRFGQYGEERVQAENAKYRAAFAKNGVDAMIAQGDWVRAGVMANQYVKDLTPELVNHYNKMIIEKQKEESEKEMANKLYESFHGDVNKIKAELDGNKQLNEEGLKAFDEKLNAANPQYVLGGDGENTGYDCGLYTQQAYAAAGITLKSRTADGQAMQMEEEGKFTTSREEAGPYSLVFWHVPGSQWESTDDPNEGGDNGGKAYKGITHVGILQPDGTVMQMGNSGHKTIALNTYEVVGFGKVDGSTYSSEEKEKIMNRVYAKYTDEQRLRRIKIDGMTDSYRSQVFQMKNSGMTGLQIYDSLTKGVTDSDTRDSIRAAVSAEGLSLAKPPSPRVGGPTARNGGYKMGDSEQYAIEQLLRKGQFNNKTDLINFMSDQGFNASALKKASSMFDDMINNKGVFKYDLNSLAGEAVDSFNVTGERKKLLKQGVIEIGKTFIMKYRAEHDGEDPDESDVKEAMLESNAAPVQFGGSYKPKGNLFFNEQFQATRAELAAKGIDRIEPVDDQENSFWVIYEGSKKSEWHTGQEIEEMFGR